MKKVLIADNMRNLVSTMKIFLYDLGDVQIDEAYTVSDALMKLKNNKYDLLVTDISFNESRNNNEGVEVAKAAKAVGVPVVVVTGVFAREEVEAEFIKIGVNKIIVKNKATFGDDLVIAAKGLMYA